MKWTRAGMVAALFLGGSASAQDLQSTQDRERTRAEVLEALAVHAGMPALSPTMPSRDSVDPAAARRAGKNIKGSGSSSGTGTGGSQGGGSQSGGQGGSGRGR